MRKVSEEMKKSCRTVVRGIRAVQFPIADGPPANRSAARAGPRTGVDDLRSLAAILIQADKFGSSIAQALRVQSDSMRTRRRQLAEEKAAKTAVKLIFPLVIFIFPAHLRGAGRPGRHHDGPRNVPGDAGQVSRAGRMPAASVLASGFRPAARRLRASGNNPGNLGRL